MLLRRSRSADGRRPQGDEDLIPLIPDIDRFERANRAQRRREQMAENPRPHIAQVNEVRLGQAPGEGVGNQVPGRMSLRDIQRPVIGTSPSCIRLSAAARNYELKGIHFNMLPSFNGLPSEDPLTFLREFYTTIQTFPLHGLAEDELRMRCFPYTLKDRAKTWLINLPEGSLGTWDEVYEKFMMKFYSPQKTVELRNKICSFSQMEGEPFHEAWDRFKMLLSQCPHHQFSLALLIQFFYDGLTLHGQTLVDTAAGGYFGDKTAEEVYDIYELLATNSQQKAVRGRRAGVHEVSSFSSSSDLSTKVDDIARKLNMILNNNAMVREQCSFCNALGHTEATCHMNQQLGGCFEEVNYMGGFAKPQQRSDPYSNTYNPGWRNHPNFSWRDQNSNPPRPVGPPGFQPRPNFQQQYQPQQQASSSSQQNAQERKPPMEDLLMQCMAKMDAKVDQIVQSQQSTIQNLERQVGQLAKAVSDREKGKLPSTSEVNPKESVMAITLRSGKELDETSVGEVPQRMKRKVVEEKKPNDEVPISPSKEEIKPHVPPIPFPQRLKDHTKDTNFMKFLEMFKKLELNIPFLEAIARMPNYAKFLKEVVANKHKLEEYALVALTEECSAMIQSEHPPKLKDPGSFIISCNFGNLYNVASLCDLGASVNLMPSSVFKKLGIQNLAPTSVKLQLADRSTRTPLGVVENVLVQVGKFFFPADFYVLEMADTSDHPIILGRPFLASGGVCIDVMRGILSFNIGKETEEFHIEGRVHSREEDHTMHNLETCCMVSISPPNGWTDSGDSRVKMDTDEEEAKHTRKLPFDLSMGRHNENVERRVHLEEP